MSKHVYRRHSQGKRVVAIVGHSKGAITSIMYAAKYDDVDKVVSISARYNMMHGITERFGDDIFERLRRGGFIEMRHLDGRTWRLTQQVGREMCCCVYVTHQRIHRVCKSAFRPTWRLLECASAGAGCTRSMVQRMR